MPTAPAPPLQRRPTPLGAPITPSPTGPRVASAASPTGGGELTVQRTPSSAIGSLASSAAAAVADSLGRAESRRTERADDPPPAYSPTAEDDPLPRYTPVRAPVREAPPAYTRVPEGAFDPKHLSDFQVDELVHRMVGRITRLIRTELRMDRERIGRLRDDHR
ncbi:hypothetical protein [Streptomyces spectabilis]|uniref:Extensin n=1 Tax=Streptomyces spectabilis TaxID=68270 RepID=A0A5P2X1X8_STRST|nr:hypothetical protein [Streptomyces spectabilis]MBB5107407.1 hypothetical protein [Streptomyces spectabilis]MCI3900095.1 hypothetical protein [Streptomyces spectabilis]QEV57714.1 hypothetical protein CP982_02470 [Streptomyces spectabilis]